MSDSNASDAATQVVEEHPCTSADELLDFLSPRNEVWQTPSPQQWIFRGQSEATWPLKAKAHRDDLPFEQFDLPMANVNAADGWNVGDGLVQRLLVQFTHGLDRVGLQVPAPGPDLFGWGLFQGGHGEPRGAAFPALALAAHFGLPTPWLDWSNQARAAAYFACSDLVWEPRAEEPGTMVVWALRNDFIFLGYGGSTTGDDVDGVMMSLESAPRASNVRLHAQAGVFTWIRGKNAHEQTVDGYLTSLWTQLADQEGFPPFGVQLPLMHRATLDRSEAPRLLRLLADEGVTAATVLPGYEGVVQAMRESAWANRGSRWRKGP